VLTAHGFHVLRIRNEAVLNEHELERVLLQLAERAQSS
jgi:very-short-patch-repair endonuclease